MVVTTVSGDADSESESGVYHDVEAEGEALP